VQVSDRVCKDFTRPGSASCCCTGTEHLRTICITTIQTHQNPQAQVRPLRYLSYSQDGAATCRGAAPESPCSVKAPVRRYGGQGPDVGFQPEPGGCFAWGSSLSVQVGNLGQGLPLFLPESASPSTIDSIWRHTTQWLCCFLSSFLPSRQTGIWVVQSVMH
jgi:hypothetical protein